MQAVDERPALLELQAWPEVIPHLTTARTAEDRYRIVGNAVPPPLARAVLARLRGAA